LHELAQEQNKEPNVMQVQVKGGSFKWVEVNLRY
jgi:hypothetical protein